MNIINKFIAKYGKKELLLTLIYPLVLPFLMMRDTGVSLFLIIRGLSQYNWKYLTANDSKNGFNNLFYYLQDLAVQESGRYGVTQYFNGGNFPLSKFFHLTPVSLRFQSSFGTVFMMFFAMCVWLASWIMIYDISWYLLLVLALVLFSTLFYACFIEIQNYNILGWMFYPVMLYYLADGNIVNVAFILFAISLMSFTATVVAIPFFVVYAYCTPWLLLALIPALIKSIIPIIRSGQIFITLSMINGKGKVKYSRKNRVKTNLKTHLKKFYLYLMLSQFVVVFFLINGFNESFVILAGTVLLFIINQSLFRIADEQSFYILYLSVATFVLLHSQINVLSLISFGFSIYLIYTLIINVRPNTFLTPGIRQPFNALPDIEKLQTFFAPIPKGEKVIMAYKNPQGQYGQLFNGYRMYNEPIQYAASLNGLSYMPDWYTVFANNKEDSPEDFWVDTADKAYNFMMKKNIYYLIVPHFVDIIDTDGRFLCMTSCDIELIDETLKLKLFRKEPLC